MSSRRNGFNPVWVVVLLFLAGLGLIWVNYRSIKPIAGQDDFTTGWVSANMYLMKGISPYDYRVAQEIARVSLIDSDQSQAAPKPAPFTEPFYALIIFAPFSLVDIHLARAIWLALIDICLVVIICGFISLSGWKLKVWAFGLVVLWALVLYNGAHAIYLGQLSVFIIFTLVGSAWLLTHGNEEGAGFLLALSLAKPELSLFVVVFMFIWSISVRRTRFYISFLAGIAFLLTITLILAPAWPLQWAGALVNSAGHPDWYDSVLSKMSFALPGIKKPLFIALHISFGLFLIIEWLVTLKKSPRYFYWAWLLTLTLSALIVPRSDTSLSLMCLGVVFQMAQVWQERFGKIGEVLIWPTLALVLAGSWAFVFSSGRGLLVEPLILSTLPPILSLLALLWIRYWVIRPSRLPLELMRDLD